MDGARIAALRARVARLDGAQRQALRAQLEAAGIAWDRVAPPEAALRPDHLPLSPAQMQFWLLHQMQPDSAAHAIAFGWHISGPLDTGALRASLAHLVARHEPLRTGFPAQDGQPWQRIVTDPGFALAETDLSATPGAVAEAERRFTAAPFDLTRPPLMRAHLLRVGETEHRLLLSFHHIIADGWSRGVFVRELAVCYRAFRSGQRPALPRLPRQFADVVLRQQDWLASPPALAQKAFWRAELQGLAPQELPQRPHRDGAELRDAATILHDLPADLSDRLRRGAAELGVTPFMLLLSVFQLLLHRLTGSDDIAVGTPTAGRSDPDAAGLIGLFVNTLVLRTRPAAGMSFRDWLDHVRERFARAFDHQDLPFASVVEDAGLARRAGHNPLFQTLFQVQTDGYGQQNAGQIDLGDTALSVRQAVLPLDHAKFDLSWHMMEHPGGLSLIAEYRPALFEAGFITRMIAQFETLLVAALAAPATPIASLSYIPAGQRLSLTGPDVPPAPTIPEQIAAHLHRDSPALIWGDTVLGHAALDAAATRLARQLRARPELAQPDPRIAICLPRGPGLVVAMLAVMKAGAAYIPLDPAHPADRRRYILADADACLMLAEAGMDAPCPVLDPATLDAAAEAEGDLPAPDPARIAYVIYTSGSTGQPKGVPITHASLANLIAAMAVAPGMAAGDRMLAITTPAFDIAGLEILLPLATGATLVLADRETAADPDRLADALERHAITHLQATPATWRLLADSGWKGASIVALCGGEALPSDLGRALLARTAALWNMYGPTETTIWSGALRVTPDHLTGPQAVIGGPIANTTLQVLDGYGQPLPAGVPGELAIGGAGLSPGYWRRPDLTAAKFAGGLYLTGDRVALNTDGTLSFLGRLDHQIKLNGYRIEAGEVEAALLRQPGIHEALVLADAAGARLIAYLRADAPQPAGALRQALAAALPGYMIPAVFMTLPAFPLNANGKIDRARLPQPDHAAPASRAPETEAERILHTLWCAVLKLDGAGVEDNFFDLGGASVSAMQIVARARKQGLRLTPAQMFDHQTIAAQAAVAEAVPALRKLPLSPWQAAHLAAPGQPWHLRLPVAGGDLERAVAAMIAAHPVLAFGLDGAWLPGRVEAGQVVAPVEDLRAAVLASGPLWRARLSGGTLEVAAHPLLLDATGSERLMQGLAEALRGDAPPALAGYAEWLTSGGGETSLAPAALPGDGPETGDTSPVARVLHDTQLRQVRAQAQALNATLEETVLTALVLTLGQWAGGPVSVHALTEAGPSPRPLGQFTRLLPLHLRAVPGDAAACLTALRRAIAAQPPRGADPRAAPPDATLFTWHAQGGNTITWCNSPVAAQMTGQALHVIADLRHGALTLHWQFDPARFRRVTVERLANRHLAELAAARAAPKPASTLDQLRAQIKAPKG